MTDDIEIFEHRGLVCTVTYLPNGEWWQGAVHVNEYQTAYSSKWSFKSEAIQDTELLAARWYDVLEGKKK